MFYLPVFRGVDAGDGGFHLRLVCRWPKVCKNLWIISNQVYVGNDWPVDLVTYEQEQIQTSDERGEGQDKKNFVYELGTDCTCCSELPQYQSINRIPSWVMARVSNQVVWGNVYYLGLLHIVVKMENYDVRGI